MLVLTTALMVSCISNIFLIYSNFRTDKILKKSLQLNAENVVVHKALARQIVDLQQDIQNEINKNTF